MESSSDNISFLPNNCVVLEGAKAVVTFADKEYFSPGDGEPVPITSAKKSYNYIPWGENDNYPNQIVTNVYSNPTMARSMEFNIAAMFGKGLRPVLKTDKGLADIPDNHPAKRFFDENDLNTWYLEQCTDLMHFYNTFSALRLSIDGSQITNIDHIEAAFSRLQERNLKGIVENHIYCPKFGTDEAPVEEDIEVTPLLFPKNLTNFLRGATGRLNDASKDSKKRRFVVPVNFPTAGRIYYQRPYWTSVITSGWLEFANQIPAFKKALMSNQMTIKYHIIIAEEYFPAIFKAENIKEPEKQEARRKREFQNMQTFLTDTKNTGKSFVTYAKAYHGTKGIENLPLVKFETLDNNFKGGEYITDSEEASNIICFALGVHPSIIGAAPGKNGSINGTEARELFNLKRALMFSYRWQVIRILYAIKSYNNWSPNLYFAVDDVALTTLDADKTGMSQFTTLY
jgi:hypothetical protein